MVCRGKVADVIPINDKVTQIVLRVKKGNIYLPVAFIAYSQIKALINQMNVEKGDAIKIEYFLKSKKWSERYSTDAVIDNIKVLAKKSPQLMVDMETGELF